MVVLHYTEGSSLEGTGNYFNRNRWKRRGPSWREAGDLNVSAHFLVDSRRDIVRLMPERRWRAATTRPQSPAIGVRDRRRRQEVPVDAAQVEANAWLLRDLDRRFPITH